MKNQGKLFVMVVFGERDRDKTLGILTRKLMYKI